MDYTDAQQYDPVSKVAQIKSKCDDNQHLKCVTDVVIPEVNYEMTGYFTCQYNDSSIGDKSDTIYVFVNGKYSLLDNSYSKSIVKHRSGISDCSL